MKLSARLQQICDQLPEGCRFADIGSDHALLPVAALKNGKAVFAVAGEVNDGPLEAAKRQVHSSGLQERISVRKGNGLEVITPGEVDVITIAGMGGALIVSILSEGMSKLDGVERLILQPNVGEDLVRRWLLEQDWYLSSESILEEDGKIYEVLTADRTGQAGDLNRQLYTDRPLPGCGQQLTKERLLLMGPWLSERPDAVFFDKWSSEIEKLEKVRRQISKSELEASRIKAEELGLQIEQWKEILACMQKDKL
ncbi:class I SAM-dependent methyltransferase [Paenibacillus sp. J22TS3]|uniref:tRNA (adenine(22)-N(1))-methyltransferase n=1 Tax=Paenibacillus sp. J22TS3 TaxID=2807192 RepID=UPI001B01C337|nr:class I SAM-dependent methyltransferase [Paenibacillus sp. J22TS3]GIP20518.1 tRNA (adenine(22)-N(1))-methyltransferase [Paenibacillus sp. J22TS3]